MELGTISFLMLLVLSLGVGITILAAGVLGMVWLYKRLRVAAIAVGILAVGATILLVVGLPIVQQTREQERRIEVQANLEALGRSLHNQEQPVARRLRPIDAPLLPPTGAIPVIAPRPTPEPPVPEWVKGTNINSNLAVVVSDQYPTAASATVHAIEKARQTVRQRLRGMELSIDTSKESLGTFAPNIRERYLERINRSTGKHQFRVYRQHLLIDVSPKALNRIAQLGKDQIAAQRVTLVGVIALALTGLASVIAGFSRTGHRWRWCCVGASFVAGALVLAAFAATA